MPQLSNKAHEAFAQAFVQCRRFSKAAEMAGSKADNLSQAGVELYERPEVKARIDELHEANMKPIGMSAARVMTEISRMATVDVSGFYHPDGTRKGPHELTPEQSACVRGFDRNGNYQFWDKNVPVTLLAKHYKIVGDEGEGVNALASALADRLNSARSRRRVIDTNPAGASGSDDMEDLA